MPIHEVKIVLARIIATAKMYWARCSDGDVAPLAILCALGMLFWGLTVIAFWPGFITNDSIDQLMQALGDKPINNWHPPIMVVVWKTLIKMTGHSAASMLVWQLTLLWLALLLLACYAYRTSSLKRLALLPIILGVAPFVVNISGVLWKDVEMAYSLALAAALLVISRKLDVKKQKYLVTVACIALIYAINLRYNALPAVLPFAWLIHKRKELGKMRYAFFALLIAGAFLTVPLISAVRPVQDVHPASSIMVDDMLHLYASEELRTVSNDQTLNNVLAGMGMKCNLAIYPVSTLIGCGNDRDRTVLELTHYNGLKSIWLRSIATHPFKYTRWRLAVFAVGFLRPDNPAQAFVWQEGTVPNSLGIASSDNVATKAVRSYVTFAAFDFGFLFRPYIWLMAGVMVLYFTSKKRSSWAHADFIFAFAMSGVLYIVSYAPLVIGYDFRYSYWSPIAVSVAAILAIMEYRTNLPKRGTERRTMAKRLRA